MNPFDHSDQDLPESFASAFARPSELLAPDEDLTTFTWPVAPCRPRQLSGRSRPT